MILKANPQTQLLGIDRDGDALERAGEILDFAADRITLKRGNFSELADFAGEAGWDFGRPLFCWILVFRHRK